MAAETEVLGDGDFAIPATPPAKPTPAAAKPPIDKPDAVETETETPSGERLFTQEDIERLAEEKLGKMREQEQLDTRARDAALQRIQQERDELSHKLTNETDARFQAVEDAITQGIAAASSEVEKYEAEAATLLEAGNYREAATANRKAAQAGFRVDTFTQHKARLDGEKKQFAEQVKARANDPLANLPPQTRDWINAHPRYLTDAKYQKKALGLAFQAEGEGHAPHSKEWLDYIDAGLAGKPNGNARTEVETPEGDDGAEAERAAQPVQQPRRPASTEIPVQRRQPGKQPSPGTIHLSADEREAADIAMGPNVTDEQRQNYYRMYAGERDRIRKEGPQ
jgi:hypothetical protein